MGRNKISIPTEGRQMSFSGKGHLPVKLPEQGQIPNCLAVSSEVCEQQHWHNHLETTFLHDCPTSQFLEEGSEVLIGNIWVMMEEKRNVTAGGVATVTAGGGATVTPGGVATVTAGGVVTVTAVGVATVIPGGVATVTPGGVVAVTAWGVATVTSGGVATSSLMTQTV